ncbi:hypothetical protein MAHJHV33_49250 [Mycobacterium avium subsp. hominissuis]
MNAAWPDPAAPLDLAALNGPGGQRYWRERAAARDAAHVEAARLAVLDQARRLDVRGVAGRRPLPPIPLAARPVERGQV